MEEQILKIIEKHCQLSSRTVTKNSAKEIADTFERFNHWKECKVLSYSTFSHKYTIDRDGGVFELSYSELYSYWDTHINK